MLHVSIEEDCQIQFGLHGESVGHVTALPDGGHAGQYFSLTYYWKVKPATQDFF